MTSGPKKHAYNCSHPPLFENIEVTHVVPDTLHLFLRLADQLMIQLISYLQQLDQIERQSPQYSAEKCKHMAKFEQFVHSLKIEWNFYVDKEQQKITSRDFTGPEHVKIFSKMDLDEIVPGHPKLSLIKTLWKDFVYMIDQLKKTLKCR